MIYWKGWKRGLEKKATGDKFQSEFYQLQQEKRRDDPTFYWMPRKGFKKIREVFPDRYKKKSTERETQMRDSMQYLYDKETTTYEVLLAAIKEAETEWVESKGHYEMKSVVANDKSENEELRKRLDKLQATMKSATADGKKEKEKKKTPKHHQGKKIPGKQQKGQVLQQQVHSGQIKNPFNVISVKGAGMVCQCV